MKTFLGRFARRRGHEALDGKGVVTSMNSIGNQCVQDKRFLLSR
jgi:hypothetical protein